MNKLDEISAVCLINRNSYLFQLRDTNIEIRSRGKWVLPGGKKNQMETSKEAAIREFYEETNYKLRIIIPIGRYFIKEYFYKSFYLSLFYSYFNSNQKIYCKEGQRLKFINKNNFNLYKIDPFIKKIIKGIKVEI
tara:strand:- start:58 stop:462 length:405 start_codon:yes stop_codon:yes gene_type:complete